MYIYIYIYILYIHIYNKHTKNKQTKRQTKRQTKTHVYRGELHFLARAAEAGNGSCYDASRLRKYPCNYSSPRGLYIDRY